MLSGVGGVTGMVHSLLGRGLLVDPSFNTPFLFVHRIKFDVQAAMGPVGKQQYKFHIR
jgi:hypothetical protein